MPVDRKVDVTLHKSKMSRASSSALHATTRLGRALAGELTGGEWWWGGFEVRSRRGLGRLRRAELHAREDRA
jgi:hypothetical protein